MRQFFQIVIETEEIAENYSIEDTRLLISQYTFMKSRLEDRRQRWEDLTRGKVLDETELILADSLQVLMNFVENQEEGTVRRFEELLENENSVDFLKRLQGLYGTIKESIGFLSQRVEDIVKRVSAVIRNESRLEMLELHRKIHEELLAPIRKVIRYMEALRRVNQESGINNTGTGECQAVIRNWTLLNIPFGLATINFHLSALNMDWPNKMWFSSLKELLAAVNNLKSVDWWYEIVLSIAAGEKEKLREFDVQLEEYIKNLKGLLPIFQNILETLSSYNF